MSETSPGGEMRLVSLNNNQAVLHWSPQAADIELDQKDSTGQPLHLGGAEHWAFQLEIDRRTGVLQRAFTLYDDLNLKPAISGAPKDRLPSLTISRSVTIEQIGRGR